MYRLSEPAFCRGCGEKWSTGADACGHCGEPRETVADAAPPRPAFRSQTRRVRWLTGLLVVNAVMLVGLIVADWLEWGLMQRFADGHSLVLEEAIASDSRQLAARIGYSVTYLATVVAFCTWLFEAGRNLRALGVGDLRWSEESRVLWFFVPVADLLLPLLGVRELWRASADPQRSGSWRTGSVSALVGAWWLMWVVSGGLAWWSLGTRWVQESTEELIVADQLGIAFAATRLLATPLLLAVVVRIHRNQERAAAALATT